MDKYKNFVATFCSAIQKGLFYKYSHPETVSSMEKSFSVLDKLFQEKDRLVAVFNSDSVFINFELVKINPLMTQFLYKFFSERSFSGVLFERSISPGEFTMFLQILTESKGKSFDDIDADLKSYNVKYAKILFYRPSMGGAGTGSGDGTGGPGTSGIYNPETGSGSFVILSSDIREKLMGDMLDKPRESQGKREEENLPERKITCHLTDEEIMSVISEGMTMSQIEERYGLTPWKRLNSLEKTLRLGTLEAIPDDITGEDISSLYTDVATPKQQEALNNLVWLFKYNIGDVRKTVSSTLFNVASRLDEHFAGDLPEQLIQVNGILLDSIFTDGSGGDNKEEKKAFIRLMISLYCDEADFQSLKSLFSRIFESNFISNYAKTEFFALITRVIELLRIHKSSPDRFILEDILLISGSLALPLLLQALMEENDKDVRRHIINTLVKSGDTAIPYLKRLLRDKRWYVVRNGIKIMGEIGTIDPEILSPLMDHPDHRIRAELVAAYKNLDHRGKGKLIVDVMRKESRQDNLLVMLNDFHKHCGLQGFNALYLYLLQNYRNSSLAEVSKIILRELILYAEGSLELNKKLSDILVWEHGAKLFKEDHVLRLKEYLLETAGSLNRELHGILLEKIAISDDRNVKKLKSNQ